MLMLADAADVMGKVCHQESGTLKRKGSRSNEVQKLRHQRLIMRKLIISWPLTREKVKDQSNVL